MFSKLVSGFALIHENFRFSRLFIEAEGVEGTAWFHKRRSDALHIFANILRLITCLFFSPLWLFTPTFLKQAILKAFKLGWLFEAVRTPDAVLHNAPGGGQGVYEATSYMPRWVLLVKVEGGVLTSTVQVPWSDEVHRAGYIAISYPMKSAEILYTEAGYELPPPISEKRRYGLEDRKFIAERVLIEYASARGQKIPDFEEYVWLDEFCLSNAHLDGKDGTEARIEKMRQVELGRLADIFRGAMQVTVFCHVVDCTHTKVDCPWGSRIFTLAEILHANQVARMTRRRINHVVRTHIHTEPAHAFRHGLQHEAALAGRWHLHAIMQHSVNSGAIPWQNAIHALIVEAILRDEAGNFVDHRFLGKALNGLLPRRARLQDLGGEDGWADLAWLLELNQGFYNATSLAAICSLGDDPFAGHGWLGSPIKPKEGNERLEPLVTSFPVAIPAPKSTAGAALCVIRSSTFGLRHELKRDEVGLYHNEEMRDVKRFAYLIWFILAVIFIIVTFRFLTAGLALLWVDCALLAFLRLVVGTMYVVRDGWIFLYDAEWGTDPCPQLGARDPNLKSLSHWAERQLIPRWSPPGRTSRWASATVVDLRHLVYTNVVVSGRPNAFITLAIHGSGVTGMLVDRPGNPFEVVNKIGMANLPPYVLVQCTPCGAVCVN